MASDGIESKNAWEQSPAGNGQRTRRRNRRQSHRGCRRHQVVRRLQGLRLHRPRQRHAGRAAARDLPAPRRLPDRLRRRAGRLRGAATPQGLAGVPRPVDGRVDRDPPGADAAAAHPCHGDADQRARARAGQMVQPAARVRLPDPRRGHARHLRAHGDAAPLRPRRAAARADRAGALRAGAEGPDGGRSASRWRPARVSPRTDRSACLPIFPLPLGTGPRKGEAHARLGV